MLNNLEKLKKDMKKSGIQNKDIALLIGKSVSSVSNYLNGEQNISFLNFVKIIELVYVNANEDVRNKFFLDYIKVCNDKNELLDAVEWCASNGKFSLRKVSSTRLREFSTNDRFYDLYDLLEKRTLGTINNRNYKKKIDAISVKKYFTEESKQLLKLCIMYSYYDLKEFNLIEDQLETISTKNLKNGYFKDSIVIRSYEIKARLALKRNQTELCREYIKKIRGMGNGFKIIKNACLALEAESYLFESPKKSIQLIEEAIINFKSLGLPEMKIRKNVLEATHDFIVNYADVENSLFATDKSEYAYFLIRKNRTEEGIRILEEIKAEKGTLSGHQYYYMYKATKNDIYLKESIRAFATTRDTFYINLPLSEYDKRCQLSTM